MQYSYASLNLVAESIMMLRSGKSSLSKEHIRIGRREADVEEESPRREGRPARTLRERRFPRTSREEGSPSPRSRREGRSPARGPLFSPVSPARSRSPATRDRSR